MHPDRIFKNTTRCFAFGFVVLVLSMAMMLFKQSLPAIAKFGLGFPFTNIWNPVTDEFGALAFIYGTLVSSFIALCIAVPFSLGIAIFLSELAPGFLKKPVGFLTELLAAIPSVIYGLWGIFYLVPWLRTVLEPLLIKCFGFLPFFQGPPYGVGMLAAGLILAIMIIPIISSISRDVFQAVPISQREAALALGATHWETIKISVLKYGRFGIFGAVFLGLGRALGETMAVTMVIGNRPDISLSILSPAHTMASVIANEYAEATSSLHLSALSGIGLTLFVVTLIVNIFARMLVWKVANAPREKI